MTRAEYLATQIAYYIAQGIDPETARLKACEKIALLFNCTPDGEFEKDWREERDGGWAV